jgi:hypothetical protein
MTKREIRVTLVAAAVVGTLAIALSAWGWHHLRQRLTLPFPIDAEPVVARRVYSGADDSIAPPENAPRLHDWPVIGDPVPVPPDVAAELRDILSSSSTYLIQQSDCFEPGMAVSFGQGPNRVDVIICLLCNRAVFYRGDQSVVRKISDLGNKRLMGIYERVFKKPVPQL